jgi:PAS domain S-box-containing protein
MTHVYLEAAFRAAPIGLAVVDRDLRYVIVNEALAAMNGMTVAEHTGRRVGEVHPELAGELEPIYRSVLASGQASVERVLELTIPAGQERVLSASHYPVHDGAGAVIAVRTVVADVTDHVRVRSAEAALRHAVRARDVFLSVASHELRTPLQSMQLVLDGLIRNRARDIAGELARKLDILRSQVQRLGLLVDNLLTVSRMASGGLSLDPDRIDLGLVVREVMVRFAPVAARAGVSLHLDADPDLVGTWDATRVEEIVTNLVSNAIKFGRGGAVHIAIEDRGDEIRLSVRDQGIGVAREDRERIFERFERAAAERSYGGIGMGLWIVRQLVLAHGGTIEVDSEPGEGATFTVTLPRAGADQTDQAIEPALPPAPPPPA